MSFIGGVLAFIFSFIIRLLFMLVSFMYSIIVYLANIDLFGFSDDGVTLLSALTTRIYVLLGIFMLFRVGFSMLTYLINPDKMSDKNSGIGKLIQRAIVALVILVLFQPALGWLMKFQNVIISSNVLGSVILGVKGDETDNMQQNFGEILPSTVILGMTSINEGWDQENGNPCKDLPTIQLASTKDECRDAVENALGNTDKYSLENLQKAENWQRWFDVEVTTAGAGIGFSGSVFANNQLLMIIIAIGFIICLFSLGLQLGVRIIELGFLAMIAPIPIIAYIEPSQGKNGMLSKWAKEFAKTYLMLFIRLAALYFAILIVIIVNDTMFSDMFAGFKDYQGKSLDSNPLIALQVKIIIMIAAFIFADQVPKLLENIFGLKFDKDSSLFKSPFKQMRDSKSLMGTTAALGSAAMHTASLLGGKGKIAQFKKSFAEGKANLSGKGFKSKAAFAMTQAGKAATLAGGYGRNRRDMAKYLKDHKDEGLWEAMQDAQVKNEERLHNRQTRQAQDMWDKMRGLDLQLEDEKKLLEKKKQAAQLAKNKIDEQIRIDKENAEKEKSLKKAQGTMSDFIEDEAKKKSSIYSEHVKKVEAAKAVSDDAKVQASKAEAELVEAKQLRDSQASQLGAEKTRLEGLKAQADLELQDLKGKSLTAPTDAVKASIDAQIEAKQQETAQIDAQLNAISTNISQLDNNVVTAEAAVQLRQANAAEAADAYLHLDKGLKDDDGNVVVQGTQDLLDEIVQAAIKVQLKPEDCTPREIELSAGVDGAKLQTLINGFEGKLTEYEEYLVSREKDIAKMAETINQQTEEINNMSSQLNTTTDPDARQQLQDKIDTARKQYEIAVENRTTAIANLEDGKEALKVARDTKEQQGYYVIDDIKDADGNVIVKGMKSGFKGLERAGISLENATQTQHGSDIRSLEATIKQLSNEIEEKAKQIQDIKEKTKGAGIADEGFDISEVSGGPGGPPPGA